MRPSGLSDIERARVSRLRDAVMGVLEGENAFEASASLVEVVACFLVMTANGNANRSPACDCGSCAAGTPTSDPYAILNAFVSDVGQVLGLLRDGGAFPTDQS